MRRIHRIKQVAKYGWQHARQISNEEFGGKKRLSIFFDIISCYWKYGLWSNQYLKEKFWKLEKRERESIGMKYNEANHKREIWLKDFYENIKFHIKYGSRKYEKESLRAIRKEAYTKHFKTGENLFVEYNVNITKQHYSDGTISIGENVLLARDCDIDYTGNLIIGNSVGILEGVKILTHSHDYLGLKKEKDLLPDTKRTFLTPLEIADNVTIGTRAVIMPGVRYIGKNSIISAGSIVTKRIPDNVIVSGNPAKVIGSLEGLNIYKRTTN